MMLKGYIHRDLAARNVLVSKDDICKVMVIVKGYEREASCEVNIHAFTSPGLGR